MSEKVMYILVNQDLKISKGKLAGQVGHAVCSFLYRHFIRTYEGDRVQLDDALLQPLDDYMCVQKKIILACPQLRLEELEAAGYITIRDKGFTELEPNTLTCVNLGLYDKAAHEVPDWVQALKLYH